MDNPLKKLQPLEDDDPRVVVIPPGSKLLFVFRGGTMDQSEIDGLYRRFRAKYGSDISVVHIEDNMDLEIYNLP